MRRTARGSNRFLSRCPARPTTDGCMRERSRLRALLLEVRIALRPSRVVRSQHSSTLACCPTGIGLTSLTPLIQPYPHHLPRKTAWQGEKLCMGSVRVRRGGVLQCLLCSVCVRSVCGERLRGNAWARVNALRPRRPRNVPARRVAGWNETPLPRSRAYWIECAHGCACCITARARSAATSIGFGVSSCSTGSVTRQSWAATR